MRLNPMSRAPSFPPDPADDQCTLHDLTRLPSLGVNPPGIQPSRSGPGNPRLLTKRLSCNLARGPSHACAGVFAPLKSGWWLFAPCFAKAPEVCLPEWQ